MKSTKFIISLITIILLSLPLYAQKLRVAVLNFKPDGVSKTLSNRISELIRIDIISSGKYIILERNQMKVIFKEQAFHQATCSDENCAVKAGKLLSVQKILVGTVIKWGKSYIITGKLIDVEKGISEIAHKQQVRNMDEIPQATLIFVQKLTGQKISSNDKKSIAGNNDKNIRTGKLWIHEKFKYKNIFLKTSKDFYKPGEKIIVEYKNLIRNEQVWVSIADTDMRNNDYFEYVYTNAKKNGQIQFKGVSEPGIYEIRVYLEWDSGILSILDKGRYEIHVKYIFEVKK